MRNSIFLILLFITLTTASQSKDWEISATNIDPNNYFGITVANGMVGLVSSPEPIKIKDIVLNGVYDNYQRGRASNILKKFNHLNIDLLINGEKITSSTISDYRQSLTMKETVLTTSPIALSRFGGLKMTNTGIVRTKQRLPGKWKSLEIKGWKQFI